MNHVWRLGVQERGGASGGEPGERTDVDGAAEGAAAHAERAGGVVVRDAGGEADGAGVGAILRGPGVVPVPQARLPRPHLPPQGLQPLLLRPHVRRRHQEQGVLPGRRRLAGPLPSMHAVSLVSSVQLYRASSSIVRMA